MTPKEFYLKLGFPPRNDKFEKSSKIFDYNDMIDFASQYHSQFEKKIDELIEKLKNQNKLNNLTKFPTGIQQAICELETKQNEKFIYDLKTLKTE